MKKLLLILLPLSVYSQDIDFSKTRREKNAASTWAYVYSSRPNFDFQFGCDFPCVYDCA